MFMHGMLIFYVEIGNFFIAVLSFLSVLFLYLVFSFIFFHILSLLWYLT